MDKSKEEGIKQLGEGLSHFGKAIMAGAVLFLIWHFYFSSGDSTTDKATTESKEPLANFNPDFDYGIGDAILKDGIEVNFSKLKQRNDGWLYFTFAVTIHDENKKPTVTRNYTAGEWFATLIYKRQFVEGLYSFCFVPDNSIEFNKQVKWTTVSCIDEKEISLYTPDLFGQEAYLIYAILPITSEIRNGRLANLSIEELKQQQDVFVFKVSVPERRA